MFEAGRLGKTELETATDYMMLFLGPALVTRSELAPHRFKLLTALWSRYGQTILDPAKLPMEQKDLLLDWFKLAVFGQHITDSERTTWQRRYKMWTRREKDLPFLPLTRRQQDLPFMPSGRRDQDLPDPPT
jgi:hypothetical protein